MTPRQNMTCACILAAVFFHSRPDAAGQLRPAVRGGPLFLWIDICHKTR